MTSKLRSLYRQPFPTMKNTLRHDWTLTEIESLFDLPFNDLMFHAQTVHRAHHDANSVQVSTLLSIKTGACPEDCAYCPQSAHFNTELKVEKLMPKVLLPSKISLTESILYELFIMEKHTIIP